MTLAPGDPVLVLLTGSGRGAIKVVPPAVGDPALSIRTDIGDIAIKHTSPQTGDQAVAIRTDIGDVAHVTLSSESTEGYPKGLVYNPFSDSIFVVVSGKNKVREYTLDGGYIQSWGITGTGSGQFSNIQGIAANTDGTLLITDSTNQTVQKFTRGGTFLSSFGSYGSGNGQFDGPRGIAVQNSTGRIIVVDYGNWRMQMFESNGSFLRTVTLSSPPYYSRYQWGVGVDQSNGYFYAPVTYVWGPLGGSDTGQVHGFDNYGNVITPTSFTPVSSYGTAPNAYGQASCRNAGDISITPSHSAWFTDQGNYCIQSAGPDTIPVEMYSTWKWNASFGSSGTGEGQFGSSTYITIDDDGNIYISDELNQRIQKFDSSGTFIRQWAVS